MSDFWPAAAGWAAHSALVGGVVLLLGWIAVRLSARPAARHLLAAWSVRAAVLAPVLCLFPAWLTLPNPCPMTADEPRPDDNRPLGAPVTQETRPAASASAGEKISPPRP